MGHVRDTCWQLHGRPPSYGKSGRREGRLGATIDHPQANLSEHTEGCIASTKASTPPSPIDARSSLSTDEMLCRIMDWLNIFSGSAPSPTNSLPSNSSDSPSSFTLILHNPISFVLSLVH